MEEVPSRYVIVAYVYLITNNITNQRYIGKTERSIETRFKKHKSNAIRNKDTLLYRSMRKYGIDNFSIIILEETTKETVSEREIYFINRDSPELNMTNGGDGGSTTHNRIWINNGFENKYIRNDDIIPESFVRGRICKFNDSEFQREMGKRAQFKIDFSKRNVGNTWNNKPVIIDGVEYISRKRAMEQLNITKYHLRRIIDERSNN